MVTIYFSGTGNSKYVAKTFSKLMEIDCYSIEDNVDFKSIILNNEVICLCYPIHFSMAPIYFRKFINSHKEYFNGKSVIIFCTQQIFSGDGARSITDILDNVRVIYANHFSMPNNITCFPTYYKLTKRNTEKCLKSTTNKIVKIVEDIKNEKIYLRGFNKFSKLLGKLQRISDESVYKKQLKAVKVTNECVLCNKCVNDCPTNNLVNDNTIKSLDVCTFCMRCVNVCPKQAISVLLHGKVTNQYYIYDRES